jgi:hypothetical protein
VAELDFINEIFRPGRFKILGVMHGEERVFPTLRPHESGMFQINHIGTTTPVVIVVYVEKFSHFSLSRCCKKTATIQRNLSARVIN